MKPKLLLLALLAIGALLHFVTQYGAFHPAAPRLVFEISYVALCLVVLLIPVVLWRMRGDRPFRIAVGAIWVSYLFLWGVAVYQTMTD